MEEWRIQFLEQDAEIKRLRRKIEGMKKSGIKPVVAKQEFNIKLP
eukprot:UN02302